MSLSDTPPAPAPASLAEKSYRMPGELLARHAITEGSKPLLSVSFGETHARKAGGISRDDLMASAAELDDEGLEEEGGTERKWEALALVALDLGGMTHIVFDPLDPSSTTMGEDGSFRVNVAACDSPRASSSTAISTPFAVPPACAAEVPPFPYVFPPRVITRQTVSGERLIGAATGATGKRAIMFSSLGGVPPVCCVRGYAPIRLRSPTRTLKENSEGEVSSSTGQSSDCADVSLENRESGGKGSTSLWVPLRPIPDVHLPVPLAKRLSIPNPIPLAAQSSSAAPATATAAATGATRPAATQFPSPSSSRASSVSSVRSGRSLFAGGGVGAGASAGAGAGAGGHGPAAHAQPGADDRPDVTDRGIGTGIGAMPSTTTTTTMLPSAGNSAPLSSPTGSSSPSPIFASNQSRSFNQTLSSAGANVNASASPPSPLPSPSLPSPSSASTPTTTSRSVPSSASASTSTSSSTVFGGAGFASRADILTEAVMDEAGGLVCLATARGNLWVADYGQGPRR